MLDISSLRPIAEVILLILPKTYLNIILLKN